VWDRVNGSKMVDLFGFRYDVGLEPVGVNLERMLHAFAQGCRRPGRDLVDRAAAGDAREN